MLIHYIFFVAGWNENQPCRAYASKEKAEAERARLNAALTQEDRDNGGSYEMASIGLSDDDENCDGNPNCEDCGCPAHDD